jgi:predicted transcriptional regulator
MATVRIDPKLHATLRALSEAEQRSISQIIEDAVDRYQKAQFWQAMHDGFARLRADPVAWSEYQAEVDLWDSTSNDGLEDYDADAAGS